MKERLSELAAPFAVVMGALLSATAKQRRVRETIWIFAAGSTLAALSHTAVAARVGENFGAMVTFAISLTGGTLLQGVIDYVSDNRQTIAARVIGKVISRSLPQESDKVKDE
jgi:glucose-6-phosphate-specific signal transduction histidine kinase